MIEKTKGIVLHQVKYSDTGIIVNLYTRKFGRLSFLIKGMRSRKSGRKNIFFQPMSVLDLIVYYRQSRGLQSLKEFSSAYAPSDIHNNIRKTCVSIFIGEVLNSVLKEESPNEELFDFIEESIIYFDESKEGIANFHIAFLSGLSSYLGFEPGLRRSVSDHYFDLLNGLFLPVPPSHANYVNKEISDILAAFFSTRYDKINDIALTGTVRNKVLETLISYYAIHLPGLRQIKSLEVLKEVFG